MPHHEGGSRWTRTDFEQYLRGCNFPCSKQDLISYCHTKSCPTDFLSFLEKMPDRQYFSMSEVMESVGEVR